MKCPSCNGLVGTGASRFMSDMSGSTMWDECPNCGPVTPMAYKGRLTINITPLTPMQTTVKRGRPRLYTDKKEKQICKEAAAGATDKELAAKYFTNVSHIKNIRGRWASILPSAPTYDPYANLRAANRARWAAYRATPPWRRALKRSFRKLRTLVAG